MQICTPTDQASHPRDSSADAAREVNPILTATTTATGAVVTVRAVGEVDLHTAPVLAETLDAGCRAAARRGTLVVDLAGIRFFSAAGLTLLVTVRRHCRERRVPLLVVAPECVLRPLRATGLDELFDVAPQDGPARTDVPSPRGGGAPAAQGLGELFLRERTRGDVVDDGARG